MSRSSTTGTPNCHHYPPGEWGWACWRLVVGVAGVVGVVDAIPGSHER